MLDATNIRRQFPALHETFNGRPAIYFDNPGGTQVPQRVIDAMVEYLTRRNANTHGAFETSARTDAVIDGARQAAADSGVPGKYAKCVRATCGRSDSRPAAG